MATLKELKERVMCSKCPISLQVIMNFLIKMDKCQKDIQKNEQEIAETVKKIEEVEQILGKPDLTPKDRVR